MALIFISEYQKTARQSPWNRYRVKQAFWPKAERFGICCGDLFAWTRGGICDQGNLPTWPDIVNNQNWIWTIVVLAKIWCLNVQKHVNICKNVKTDDSNPVFALVIGHMSLISYRHHHCSFRVLAVYICTATSTAEKMINWANQTWFGLIMGSVLANSFAHTTSPVNTQQPRCKRVKFDPCFHVLLKLRWNLNAFLSWYKPGYSWRSVSKMLHWPPAPFVHSPLSPPSP